MNIEFTRKKSSWSIAIPVAKALSAVCLLGMAEWSTALPSQRTVHGKFLVPEISLGGSRGIGSTSKLDLAMDLLLNEKSTSRGPNQTKSRLGSRELQRIGIDPTSADPLITATVELASSASMELVRQARISVLWRVSSFVTVRGRLSSIAELANDAGVRRITLMTQSAVSGVSSMGGSAKGFMPEVQPKTIYTGKGVAIAVIDSGIDWTHQDFIKQDGSTRILAIYDIEDRSWKTSHGKIGSKPPISDENGPVGTVYTSQQINMALRGRGKVTTRDKIGFGTAVAGVALGNGMSVPSNPRRYQGVAPGASLIVVKAGDEAMIQLWAPFAQWARSISNAHHMPLVVDMSGGSQSTNLDGTQAEELELNALVSQNKRGFAIAVAAGDNAADQSISTGRFNARLPDQMNFEGREIEATSRPRDVGSVPPLVCNFSQRDDWGLMLVAHQAPYIDDAGHGITMQITKIAGHPMVAFDSSGEIDPMVKQRIARSLRLTTDSGHDSLTVPLPSGTYTMTAFGAGPVVKDGRFTFSLPLRDYGFFSKGASSNGTIDSPGNATRVITVGSYNGQNSVESLAGHYRLKIPLGSLADYSGRGSREVKWVKPDLAGPGVQISSLASGSNFQRNGIDSGGFEIAAPGRHAIWQGTSAATAYVSGVIALMLEKNPHLSSDQIRKILIQAAKKDKFTSAVPNPDWGFGKVDVVRALSATPKLRKGRR